jgi:hypothetical protein
MGVWGRGSRFKVSPGEKLGDPILTNKKPSVVVHTCHPSYMGSINRRIEVQS